MGDIHSNYDALMVVVGELRQEHVDKILCVGDIVGYAAEPAKCIDLVRELNCTVQKIYSAGLPAVNALRLM